MYPCQLISGDVWRTRADSLRRAAVVRCPSKGTKVPGLHGHSRQRSTKILFLSQEALHSRICGHGLMTCKGWPLTVTDRLTVSDSLVVGTSRILETSTQKSAAIQLWRCDALGVTGLDILTNGRCDTSASFLQKYFAVAKRRTEFDRIYSRTFCNIEQHETRKTPDILGTLTSSDLWSADCGTCTWYFNSISSNKYSSSLSLKRHVSRTYENHWESRCRSTQTSKVVSNQAGGACQRAWLVEQRSGDRSIRHNAPAAQVASHAGKPCCVWICLNAALSWPSEIRTVGVEFSRITCACLEILAAMKCAGRGYEAIWRVWKHLDACTISMPAVGWGLLLQEE